MMADPTPIKDLRPRLKKVEKVLAVSRAPVGACSLCSGCAWPLPAALHPASLPVTVPNALAFRDVLAVETLTLPPGCRGHGCPLPDGDHPARPRPAGHHTNQPPAGTCPLPAGGGAAGGGGGARQHGGGRPREGAAQVPQGQGQGRSSSHRLHRRDGRRHAAAGDAAPRGRRPGGGDGRSGAGGGGAARPRAGVTRGRALPAV